MPKFSSVKIEEVLDIPSVILPNQFYLVESGGITEFYLSDSSANLYELISPDLSTWLGSTSITTLGTITTGTWNADTIAINKGGTGQITANAALNALLPNQTGNSGKVLSTDGVDTGWTTISVPTVSGTPNYIPKFDGTTSLIDSNISDDGTNIILGVTPGKGVKVNSSAGIVNIGDYDNLGNGTKIQIDDDGKIFLLQHTADIAQFIFTDLKIGNTGATARFRITSGSGDIAFGDLEGAGNNTIATFNDGSQSFVTNAQFTASSYLGTWVGNAIAAIYGGTGQTGYTTGDILYASSSSALSALADTGTGNALLSGGVGVAPLWGKIGLTTHVTGTLGAGNGGTGITSLGTGVATFLGTPSSANLAAALTDETGTAGKVVFDTAPTFQTSINMASGGAYKYNAINVLRADTSLGNYFFGTGGNLTASGSNNIAVGSGLGSLTSGAGNCAIGILSGSSLTSGSDNLFFGFFAGSNTTTGVNNCFYGSSAGITNTEGSHNTAFGREALTTNHKGYYNTAVGHNALKLVDSATVADLHNTGLGAFAGSTITTGTKNTIVGSNSTSGITTTSGNTVLGANVTGLAGLSNNIVLADGDGNICLQYDGTVWQVKKGLAITDAKDIEFGTSTGTKIGTGTTQKLAFWNASPIAQPTTGVASATYVGNIGTTVTVTGTFDGYTLGQIVKALRNAGLLA